MKEWVKCKEITGRGGNVGRVRCTTVERVGGHSRIIPSLLYIHIYIFIYLDLVIFD